MSNFDKDVIEVQLSHMDEDKIRGTYNRAKYIEQRKQMMGWWANYLEACEAGKKPNTRTDRVISIKSKKGVA